MNSEKLLEGLVKEGKLKRQKTNINYLEGLLCAAKENFSAARNSYKSGFKTAAFKSAYDGLLQISRTVLLLNGYLPDDGEQHKTTFYVASLLLGADFKILIDRIDRYRIKRNQCLYQPLDLISSSEAEGILSISQKFCEKTEKYFRSKNPQLGMFNG